MFIRKSRYDRLVKRVETLERQIATHAKYLHNDHNKLGRDYERLERLEEVVGVEGPSIFDSYTLSNIMARKYFGYDSDPEPKKLTLVQKVSSIMDHLGLVVAATKAETKLVKKPVRATAKKKGKK